MVVRPAWCPGRSRRDACGCRCGGDLGRAAPPAWARVRARSRLGQAGARRELLRRGDAAGVPSAFAEFSEPRQAALERWMEDIYRRFKARVAAGRKKTPEEVEAVARGRVWAGRDAAARGLVDELGDFETAVRKAKQLAGIPIEADVPVLTIRPPRSSSVPAAPPAAWAEALRAAGSLLREHAWLVI